MLAIQALRTPTRLEPGDLKRALLQMDRDRWRPAVTESLRTLCAMAGVDEGQVGVLTPISGTGSQFGDIVFSGDCLYYVLSAYDEEPFVEVGAIRSNDGGDPQLLEFSNAITDAITSTLDGRKTRHMQFTWTEVKRPSGRLDQVVATERGDEGVEHQRASLDAPGLAGAATLESLQCRSTLIEISRAGFVREHDILSRKTKTKDEIRAAIDDLKSAGLVVVENLIECRKTGTPITRLANKEKHTAESLAGLNCAACGQPFSEEALTEGYSVSDLGKRLIQKSHWMTIAVTKRLVDIGVPEESILWNVSESGEEVDIIVDVLGSLWIFELKDREFGAGDAHPFNYRQVRYQASKSVVVTTDKVSSDAKRVFKDLTKEGRGRAQPTYIEGLENATDILRAEIENSFKQHAARKMVEVSVACGFNLRPLITRFVGELPAQRDEIDEMSFFLSRSMRRIRHQFPG
jgi:hypothetical protein